MSSHLSAPWAEPPWGADPRFELGPALQKASALSHAAPYLSHGAPYLSHSAPYLLSLVGRLELTNDQAYNSGGLLEFD